MITTVQHLVVVIENYPWALTEVVVTCFWIVLTIQLGFNYVFNLFHLKLILFLSKECWKSMVENRQMHVHFPLSIVHICIDNTVPDFKIWWREEKLCGIQYIDTVNDSLRHSIAVMKAREWDSHDYACFSYIMLFNKTLPGEETGSSLISFFSFLDTLSRHHFCTLLYVEVPRRGDFSHHRIQ